MKALGYIGTFGAGVTFLSAFPLNDYHVPATPLNSLIWFGILMTFIVLAIIGITSPKFKSSRIGY